MTARIALVTGANTGIGFEVVRSLAQQGFVTYLGSRDAERGQAAARELAHEGEVRPLRIDLQDGASLQAAIDHIDQAHSKLDVLVNNAGASLAGTILDVTPEIIEESFQTNLHGPVRLAQLAVPLLRRSAAGRIVNVSSVAGTFGFMSGYDPERLPYSYAAAKAAFNAATVMLASALKPDGIKVNAASPGLVKTRVSRFMGERMPADGAKIIVELATLDENGPTGGFFSETGPVPW